MYILSDDDTSATHSQSSFFRGVTTPVLKALGDLFASLGFMEFDLEPYLFRYLSLRKVSVIGCLSAS